MQDHLVGYLLGALDVDETSFVERSLATDAEVRRQLETLRCALVPLESDRQQMDAPQGLAARTCQQLCEIRNARGA